MNISKHGDLRARERMGIPRKAVKRAAAKAMTKGVDRLSSRGALRSFVEATHRKHLGSADAIKVYGNHVFIFADSQLVTVYQVPAWGR